MILPLLLALALLPQDAVVKLTHGPLRGACDTTSMEFWARASAAGEYTLELRLFGNDLLASDIPLPPVRSEATAENDFTLHWRVEGLQPDTAYAGYSIHSARSNLWDTGGVALRTAVADDNPRASLLFGSCCEEQQRTEQPIWYAMQRVAADALVLLGDTPYIESNDLAIQRRRYQEFLAFEPVRSMLSRSACYFTWDDHDYATNDKFGLIPGREQARRAFLEYHASQTLGQDGEGIFTSFRRGPMEVFVLDTRWFADIESSPLAKDKRSLLGAKQIAWLQKGLLASTAPFKVLACGMVWNNAVRPGKLDCWGNWLDERDGLLRWIGANRIAGLVLVGGDIHRSRVILHPVKELVGYDVPEFISSPLAQSPIEAAKVDAPGLLFDVGSSSAFLWLETSRAEQDLEIRGHILDEAGKELFVKGFGSKQLSRP